jgi:hypothetical protein
MTTLVQYDKPDLPTVGSAAALAQRIIIDDQTTYEIASTEVSTLKARRAEIDGLRKGIVDPINKAKDAVQALFNPVLADYDAAERIIKGKMVTYVNAQAEIQRKAQAEADRVAREAAEAAEKAAKKLEKKGDVEAASAIREIAAVTSAPVIAPLVTNVGGNSIRKKWKARLVDKSKALAHAASNPAIDGIFDWDQGAADRYAAATSGKSVIPGVEFYEDSTVAIRK